jgi:hypothetical protein
MEEAMRIALDTNILAYHEQKHLLLQVLLTS